MKIKMNYTGQKEKKERSSETYRMIFGGPIIVTFFLIFGMVWANTYSDKYLDSKLNLYAVFSLFGLLALIIYVLLCVILPISAAKKFNRVIDSFSVNESIIMGTTCKIAWLPAKVFKIPKDKAKISKVSEINYGNGLKRGIIISINEDEYYLIEDFIDDFNLITTNL